eukprot:6528838-Prymnesium_polylepis.1
MAAEMEAQSGEPEKEIRAKIEQLRGILEARPAVVAQQLARLEHATSNVTSTGADGPEEDGAAQAILEES